MRKTVVFRFVEMGEGNRQMLVKSKSFKSAKRTLRRRLGKKEAKKFACQ